MGTGGLEKRKIEDVMWLRRDGSRCSGAEKGGKRCDGGEERWKEVYRKRDAL